MKRTDCSALLQIIAGSAFFALSMASIRSVSIIPGNIIGIGTMLNALLGWPIGLVNIALNIPIMAVGAFMLGWKSLFYTLIALVGTSVLTDWWGPILATPHTAHIVLRILWASLLMGLGCGLILRAGATTGGTTMIVRLINVKYPALKLGNLLIALDGIIILVGALLLHDMWGFFYSILYEMIICGIINLMVYGIHQKQEK